MWVGTIQPIEGMKEQRVGEKENSLFLCLTAELRHQSSPALELGLITINTLVSQAFGLRLEFISLAFLGHQLIDGRLWDFSVPTIT